MAATKDFYYFGVSKLEMADIPVTANTTPVWERIPSIEQATLAASASEVKVYGDNTQQYAFVHSPEMQLNVRLTKVSGNAVEKLSGNIASTASGLESNYILTNKDLSPPQKMLRVTIAARDNDTGQPRDLHIVLFKTQARLLWDGFGAERGSATELNWTFDILAATKDERGNALPAGTDFAFGKYSFPTA